VTTARDGVAYQAAVVQYTATLAAYKAAAGAADLEPLGPEGKRINLDLEGTGGRLGAAA
jgi:hypothetical protein